MPKLSDISAVIFDMDGLVLDTETTYFVAWQQAANAMGYVLSDSFCLSLSGLHYKDIEPKLMAWCGADFNLQAFNQLSGIFCSPTRMELITVGNMEDNFDSN